MRRRAMPPAEQLFPREGVAGGSGRAPRTAARGRGPARRDLPRGDAARRGHRRRAGGSALMPETRILLKGVHDPDQPKLATYVRHGGYTALRKALGMQADELIETVKASGIRGRGGAGALCGMKWGFMPKEPTPQRPNYLICNADESEPGSFNNRELLERDPHQTL